MDVLCVTKMLSQYPLLTTTSIVRLCLYFIVLVCDWAEVLELDGRVKIVLLY